MMMKSIAIIVSVFFSVAISTTALSSNFERNSISKNEVSNSLYAFENDSVPSSDNKSKSIYGEDSAKCVRNLSIYVEYYRQRNYGMAVEPWRWVYENCPAARQNTYIHGANLIKYLYSNENDPVRREMYVDSLMQLYDKRIKYFNKEGSVLGRKAADLYTFRPNNVLEIYEISEKSITLEGNESSADVILINFHSLSNLVDAGAKDVEEIVKAFDRAMNIIDHNIAANGKKVESYNVAKNNIDAMFTPYASCENITNIYKPRFDNNPKDVELLEKIIEMLDKSGCTDEKLFYDATLSLHEINPTAESAFLMGKMEQESGNYNRAVDFFEQALPLYENEEEKFSAYMRLVEILFRKQKKYSEARSYALKAADARPNDGRPYLLIAEMYADSAKQCGDNEFTEKVAYWAAVDKAFYAKKIDDDSAVADRADVLIDAWSKHFPTKENIFFYGFDEGESYTVKCWINETTRIRAR